MSRRLHLRRWLSGCYYFGCFAPLVLTVLMLWIAAETALRPLRALYKYARRSSRHQSE